MAPGAATPGLTQPCPRAAPGVDRLLDRMLGRLIWAVAPREVILFGSQCKGLAGRGSDVDLLVITDAAPDAVLTAAAFDATRGALKCDVLLRDAAALAREASDRYGFLAGILAGGWTVYRRPGAPAAHPACSGPAPMAARSALARG